MQGIGDIKGNYVVDYIQKSEVPADRIITYANMICNYRPLKSDHHRVQLTVRGDKLDHPDDTVSPTASLLETKLLLNSTISDAHKGARFSTLDIKDFSPNVHETRIIHDDSLQCEYISINPK